MKKHLSCFCFIMLSTALIMFSGLAFSASSGPSSSAKVVSNGVDYTGKPCHGDMQSKKIPHDVYECHYDNGFSGAASSGWPSRMNFAWSRIAAAQECGGVKVSMKKLMPVLVEHFKQGASIQKLVGIQFHRAQIHFDPKFCTAKRVAEYKKVLPGFYLGKFPEK